jgi:hypothetical protein
MNTYSFVHISILVTFFVLGSKIHGTEMEVTDFVDTGESLLSCTSWLVAAGMISSQFFFWRAAQRGNALGVASRGAVV